MAGQVLYRVLDEAAGITTTYGRGTPSPGALYPLDCYVTVANVEDVPSGFYGYDPYYHRLVSLNIALDPRAWLTSVLAYQDLAGTAAFHVFTVASFDRVRVKYGQRAYRFALIEAGHLVQSMLLIAEAEGIGGAPSVASSTGMWIQHSGWMASLPPPCTVLPSATRSRSHEYCNHRSVGTGE